MFTKKELKCMSRTRLESYVRRAEKDITEISRINYNASKFALDEMLSESCTNQIPGDQYIGAVRLLSKIERIKALEYNIHEFVVKYPMRRDFSIIDDPLMEE